MADDLQRIFDEVSKTVHSARARDTSDVRNLIGQVLEEIVGSFEPHFANWLMTSATIVPVTQTLDVSGTYFTVTAGATYDLYKDRIFDMRIAGYWHLEYENDISAFDNFLTVPSGTPRKWGWSSYQNLIFDVAPQGVSIVVRYQRPVVKIDSASVLTTVPDIPGYEGYNLVLNGVLSKLKKDINAPDMRAQYGLYREQLKDFQRNHEVVVENRISPVPY